MKPFESNIEVRWADCDSNKHVRHSAYYDYGAHCRIQFFAKIGFGSAAMSELNIGPILFKEECTFMRELSLDDVVRINVLKGETNKDASRWIFHHEIFNIANIKCAHISLTGAWIDISKRKLTSPPPELANLIHQLPEGDYYIHQGKKH